MTAISISRIAVPSLALVAATGAAIAFGLTYVRHAPPPETATATVAPAMSQPLPRAADGSSAALATAKDQASAVAAVLAPSPPAAVTDETVPIFDVARIEKTGDAVIAGRAAPGATVELLRNGERYDGAVADQSGQFVMVPPRLPPGNYELTLRARLPDGALATSKHGVAVALDDVPSTGALQSRAEAPAAAQGAMVANRSRPDAAVSQPQRIKVASADPDEAVPSAVVRPRMSTRVVARGDSLWHISRVSYGDGTRYAVVYNANRERIRGSGSDLPRPDLFHSPEIALECRPLR